MLSQPLVEIYAKYSHPHVNLTLLVMAKTIARSQVKVYLANHAKVDINVYANLAYSH